MRDLTSLTSIQIALTIMKIWVFHIESVFKGFEGLFPWWGNVRTTHRIDGIVLSGGWVFIFVSPNIQGLRNVALRNRMALDIMLTSQGGVGHIIWSDCCTYIHTYIWQFDAYCFSFKLPIVWGKEQGHTDSWSMELVVIVYFKCEKCVIGIFDIDSDFCLYLSVVGLVYWLCTICVL